MVACPWGGRGLNGPREVEVLAKVLDLRSHLRPSTDLEV